MAACRQGRILVSVHCDNSTRVGRVKDILKQTGAASTGEAGSEYVKTDKRFPAIRSQRANDQKLANPCTRAGDGSNLDSGRLSFRFSCRRGWRLKPPNARHA
jgi:hypothetical protein